MCLVSRVGDRHDLVEGFLLADHAEVGPRTFFGGIPSLLEIDHLGIEGCITITQRLVERTLFNDSIPEFQRLSVSVVGQPELGLQTEPGDAEQNQ